MRIALVSQEYPPETAKGGIATQTFQKAHGMAARGHEVCVISHTAGETLSDSRDGLVRVIRTPGFYRRMTLQTPAAEWLTYSAEVAAVLDQLNREEQFELVDFPEWGAEGYVHLLNSVPGARAAVVIHLHGPLVMLAHTIGWPETDSEFYRVAVEMERTCLRLADAVFSSSQCAIDWCQRHHEFDGRNVPVIHTGVDTAHFAPRALLKSAEPRVLFVGRIAASKGVETLLEACIALRDEFPDLRLRMVGHGNRALIETLQRAAPVGMLELTGYVSSTELPKELARAQVFAAPSQYEGGPGFVYLEAMSCGLPAVACAGSGVAEVIVSGDNGMLVPANDPVALAKILRDLLRDKALRESIGRRAREWVVAHAAREQCLDRIEAFYSSVVERIRRTA